MKRLLVVCGMILMAMTTLSYADLRIGLKGGAHLGNASFDGDDAPDTQLRPGTIHGPYVEFTFGPEGPLALRTEALWVDKGWKEEADILGVDYKAHVSAEELVLAPFLVYYFGDMIRETAFFLEAGPELGLSINTWRIRDEPEILEDFDEIENLEDEWAGTNFGLNFGAGVSFRAGMGRVTLDGRYNLGMADMWDADDETDVMLNGIQLQIGYDFSVYPQNRRL